MSIHPMHHAFYSESLRFHCQSALSSSHVVGEILKTPEARSDRIGEIDGATDTVLDSLQNLLIHAGAISRYFWPSKKGDDSIHKVRSKSLKHMYGINDDSSLKNRKLRNALEHFDENLDKYLRDEPMVGVILPSYVGMRPSSDDGIPSHIFRAYYTDEGVFSVLGDEYEVQPVVSAVHELLNMIVK